tara:strand:- start:1525 stop:2052 length:528 start_codon:yes stop_codon:yes gene_type:complete
MINILDTDIEDLKIIEPKVFDDERGYFFESFNQNEFKQKIGDIKFIQDNESYSKYGVLRGLHYQINPYQQNKLVRVIKGEVQDIAVDLRRNSLTYLKYVSCILNDKNKRQFFIPKGFAHGFLVLSNYAIVNYKVDNYYFPEYEKILSFKNKDLSIKWKLEYNDIILSKKDTVSQN